MNNNTDPADKQKTFCEKQYRMEQKEIFNLLHSAIYALRENMRDIQSYLIPYKYYANPIGEDELRRISLIYQNEVATERYLWDVVMQLDTERPCPNIIGRVCRGIHNCDHPCYEIGEYPRGGDCTQKLIEEIRQWQIQQKNQNEERADQASMKAK